MKHKFSPTRVFGDCDITHQSIFSCLTPGQLEYISIHKDCLVYKKGQHIFNEGSYPLGIYGIDKGKVKLEHSGDDGKMQILRMAKGGDLLGYRALFCQEKYNASAVAIEDANLFFIPKDIFLEVLHDNMKLALNIIQLLTHDLKQAENHLTELAQKPVRERMARGLLFLKETYGLEEDQQTINVSLSREEIADLIGTATETAIRLLSELKTDGIIAFAGKRIQILNLMKLNKVAHNYQNEFAWN